MPFQGGTSFVDHLCYLCLVFVMLSALWSPVRKGLTSWLLFVKFNCVFVTFKCGILGQVRYLIVSIPDLFRICYFEIEWSLVGASPKALRYVLEQDTLSSRLSAGSTQEDVST